MTPYVTPYYDEDGVTLYHGDCRDVLPHVAAVDHVITDPPYAISEQGLWHVGRPGKGKRRFDFFPEDADWADIINLVVGVARQTSALQSDCGTAYWWCGHREFGPLVNFYESAGWKTRLMVWAKSAPSPPPPGAGWPSGAELCVHAFRPGRTWNHTGAYPPPSNVIWCDSFRHGQPGKEAHPTQKPEQVIRPLILASTLPGDIVLDPFAGSGTTLIEAKRHGRRAIGIEREERYCELAARRLRQGALPLHETIQRPTTEATP